MATGRLRLNLEPVTEADFEALAALREAALRVSLERLGRFDQERSRARLRGQFWPEYMRHIVSNDDAGGKRVGLLTLKPEGGALKLHHLYLTPASQGLGIGGWALDQVKAEARAQGRDVTLEALKQSDAHRFYQRHGFVQVGEEAFDVLYRWTVTKGAVS